MEANELLYAMKHGAKFGNGKTASQIREEWANGRITADNIADMAAKAENSKPSSGARETMSWDEIRRTMQSEIDAACQAIAKNYSGIALGRSPADIDRMLNRLLELTARAGSGVTMSLDASG
jgi:hypothetical protein